MRNTPGCAIRTYLMCIQSWWEPDPQSGLVSVISKGGDSPLTVPQLRNHIHGGRSCPTHAGEFSCQLHRLWGIPSKVGCSSKTNPSLIRITSADIQSKCVNMIARLFNAPTDEEENNAMGVSTVGSSEVCFLLTGWESLLTIQAIMLATLAMKKRWQNKRKAEGKDYSKPNIIMNSAVQVCWEYVLRYPFRIASDK